jgi:hypothetical protein
MLATLQATMFNGKTYTVTGNEDQLLTYISRKTSTTLFDATDSLPGSWVRLDAIVYPQCEHGMSAQMCSGPNHFGEASDDWAN